jgi:hypothetical protein
MAVAEVRVSGLSNRKESIRERLPGAIIEKGDVVMRSPLDPSKSLNEHLVWLWGMLKHQRRFLKNLQQEGGKLTCRCEVPKGDVRLLPNAAEMLHLLEMDLVIKGR